VSGMADTKKSAKETLDNVNPNHIFFVCDGSTLSNVYELAAALRTMNDGTFSYHANAQKNDFSNWVNDVLHDPTLAKKIKGLDRIKTQKEIEKRIKTLEKKK
jgi:hypothetical protein